MLTIYVVVTLLFVGGLAFFSVSCGRPDRKLMTWVPLVVGIVAVVGVTIFEVVTAPPSNYQLRASVYQDGRRVDIYFEDFSVEGETVTINRYYIETTNWTDARFVFVDKPVMINTPGEFEYNSVRPQQTRQEVIE